MAPGVASTESKPALVSARTDATAAPGRWPTWPLCAGIVLLVMMLVRGFLIQSFLVSSVSMQRTLEPGDRVLVDRTIDDDDLRRGDIVVFDGTHGFASAERSPHQAEDLSARTLAGAASLFGVDLGEQDFVKRIVGLPGDRVACCDGAGRVTVNGVGIVEGYLSAGERPSEISFEVTVPAERVWVMGDHRSESADSRAHLGEPGGGVVAVDNIVGRASARYWPLSRIGDLSLSSP